MRQNFCTILYSVVYHTIPCNTIPYQTMQYHTTQYQTIPFSGMSKLRSILQRNGLINNNYYDHLLFIFRYAAEDVVSPQLRIPFLCAVFDHRAFLNDGSHSLYFWPHDDYVGPRRDDLSSFMSGEYVEHSPSPAATISSFTDADFGLLLRPLGIPGSNPSKERPCLKLTIQPVQLGPARTPIPLPRLRYATLSRVSSRSSLFCQRGGCAKVNAVYSTIHGPLLHEFVTWSVSTAVNYVISTQLSEYVNS